MTTVEELGIVDALMVRLLSLWGPGARERPPSMHPRLGCVTTPRTVQDARRGDAPLFFLRWDICWGLLCGAARMPYSIAVKPAARETT